MKKLSIITINFNNAEGLERTIKSVISQSNKDFQYIVIDGGSTDGSIEVLDKYKAYLDVSVSEHDTGIYNAMNKGAGFATSEYMLFLNSGDELYEKNVTALFMADKSDADIICGHLMLYSPQEKYYWIPPQHITLFSFIGGSSLPHPSSFIKKSIFIKCGGYIEKYRIISDWCFFIESLIINNSSYSVIPHVVSKFVLDGISTNNPNMENEDRLLYLKEKFPRIIDDYLSLEDEAIANTSYWFASIRGKKIFTIPFKIINRFCKLRSKISKRIMIEKFQ